MINKKPSVIFVMFCVLSNFWFGVNIYSQTGIIREVTGEVEIKPAGSANFTKASAGSTVEQNTIISTGFKSSAMVEVGSNKIIVRPLTRLTLAEITASANTETLNVNLQTGRIRIEVKPPAGSRASTQVQSPSATASVRGTDFEMDTVNVIVTEGKVMFMGTDGLGVPVNAGSSSLIGDNGGSIEPVIIAEMDLAPSNPAGMGEASENKASSSSGGNNVNIDLLW